MHNFLIFYLVCSMINITVVTVRQFQEPVCDKAHYESMLYNGLLGPISTFGCLILLGYLTYKKLL